ncbi:MAG: transcriptional regulator [Acidimicrobiales bacterium]
MTTTATRSARTLLKALVRERRLTVGETVAVLERRAGRMGESGFALTERQLRRWLKGDVSSTENIRPANIRVTEAEFDWPMATLLSVDQRTPEHRVPRPAPHEDHPLRTEEFVGWVAEHSALSYETVYTAVVEGVARIAAVSPITRATLNRARSRVGRAQLASALRAYYGDSAGFYTARVGRLVVELSILAGPAWVGLALPLGGVAEACRLATRGDGLAPCLSDQQARAAIERLAAVEAGDTMMVNNPLYRLAAIDIRPGELAAEFGCTSFATYALTVDLLESELRDQMREGVHDPNQMRLPLRDAWLPTSDAGLALDRRVCVGGPVCLVAIADGDQYHLLVQERSAQVLNVTGALAVIPKAFHQPIVDPHGETRISMTLERELEEELFGRPDLEQLSAASWRRAAPLHPLNASAPMEWLHSHPEAWQMECTGFGVNMVSGNYEFSCLVVIRDPTWWCFYGNVLEANWEAMRLHRYSSLDHAGVLDLIGDPRWSNEGLFAILEGLRRLAVLDPARVRVPVTEVAA